MEQNPIRAYKGFDKSLCCRGFQYEVGKKYEHQGEVKACQSGFHACENPFDVFGYYPPGSADGPARYCEVEQSGKIDKTEDKTCSSRLRIRAEIGLNGLVNAGVKFILDRVKKEDKATNTGYQSAATNTGYQSAATNTGDRSAATNTGYRSAATNTGDRSAATNTGDQSAATNTGDQSAATNTGDQSAATVEGKESIAIVTGRGSRAKGALGCWLVLTERDEEWHILGVKAAKIDGETIKADTWYRLVNGEFTECDD